MPGAADGGSNTPAEQPTEVPRRANASSNSKGLGTADRLVFASAKSAKAKLLADRAKYNTPGTHAFKWVQRAIELTGYTWITDEVKAVAARVMVSVGSDLFVNHCPGW